MCKENNLLYLLKFYVTTVVIFIAAKLMFILCNAPTTPLVDILQVVGHGLSLDLSTALYFLVVPLLAVIVSLWVKGKGFRKGLLWFLRCYYVLLSLAFALAFVADTSLYAFWAFKLDASCLQYLQQPEGITASVSVLYMLVRLFLVIIAAIVFYVVYSIPPSCPSSSAGSVKSAAMKTLGYLALTPFMVIGIRGGLSESTTNIGQVYFSENQFLNHAAVNPVFSFIYSFSHQVGDISQYHFISDEEARSLVDGVYTNESIPADSAVSLLTTTTPDIVVILMESAGDQFAGVMPRLQQLKREGVNFTECYANSWRTDRGTLSLLSGYPSFPTLSVMKMPHKSRTLPSIAASLRARGYANHYLYGGDINFTNMRSYLLSTGWQTLTSMDDYSPSERSSAKWGVRDDITFRTLYHLVTTPEVHADGQPFLIGFSTLSSHEPWDVPFHRHADPILNAFAYLDDCLGSFVDSLKATPQWQNLLIVVTSDHGIIYGAADNSNPRLKNHIPMLWLGGAIREPRTVDILCNQSDLPATLLAQMDISHQEFTFSRDIFSSSYTHPTAVNNYTNAQWVIDASGQLLFDLDARQVTLYTPHASHPSSPTHKDSLLRLNQAILQLTTTDLSNR